MLDPLLPAVQSCDCAGEDYKLCTASIISLGFQMDMLSATQCMLLECIDVGSLAHTSEFGVV